jgi:formiminotetrahydrofolate cyclodeaminase
MDHDEKLANRSIDLYLDMVASDAPAPGGGSVAGVVGGLAAALGEMVVSLTSDAPHKLLDARDRLAALRASAVAFGAADELAYPGYLEATRLPKSTPEEKAYRKAMMQEAMKEAATTPMQLAETALEMLTALEPVMEYGNRHVLSDAAVAVLLARACIDACLINVRTNLAAIRDVEFVGSMAGKTHKLEEHASQLAEHLQSAIASREKAPAKGA